MTWENHGSVWHIDHIIPISAFNIISIGCIDFRRCWALKNLQPLFVKENISKHNKLAAPFQPALALELDRAAPPCRPRPTPKPKPKPKHYARPDAG